MDYVWELIAPYVAAIGGAGGAGIIIYTIIRALMNKVFNKNNTLLNSTFNTDVVSQKVAEKLAGKTLNIDVTAVTEKALKKLSKQLDEKIEKVETATNSYKHLLALIGNALTKLKALSKEEISELASAIKALDGEYIPTEPNETMTVVLEPISNETDNNIPGNSGVNFEGLE